MTDSAQFDWSLARAFLAAAEQGSFSGAARQLGLTQPTLGRQVAALEQSLGITLFERGHRSLSLTTAGVELLDHVRAMRDAAERAALSASGQSQAIEGQVTISATDIMALHHLPAALLSLRKTAPGIVVDIVAANEVSDLRRREADIAIRHVRPTQPDLIARQIGEMRGWFWAAKHYLDANGRPGTISDLTDHDFVSFDDPARMIAYLDRLSIHLKIENFRIGSANGTVAWQLIREGFGIGVMTDATALITPDVECVLPDMDPIPVPVWLVTHRELHTSRRIRVVFDTLVREIGMAIKAARTAPPITVRTPRR